MRNKEKKKMRNFFTHEKKKSFETCLVSLFPAVGFPPILAMLVSFQQHKLPPAITPIVGTKRKSRTPNQKKSIVFNIK
jgi:hypothetical protein